METNQRELIRAIGSATWLSNESAQHPVAIALYTTQQPPPPAMSSGPLARIVDLDDIDDAVDIGARPGETGVNDQGFEEPPTKPRTDTNEGAAAVCCAVIGIVSLAFGIALVAGLFSIQPLDDTVARFVPVLRYQGPAASPPPYPPLPTSAASLRLETCVSTIASIPISLVRNGRCDDVLATPPGQCPLGTDFPDCPPRAAPTAPPPSSPPSPLPQSPPPWWHNPPPPAPPAPPPSAPLQSPY